MRSFDLICNDCRHRYRVESESGWMEEDKQCPKCGSHTVHQALKSYLRNGALLSAESLVNAQYRCSSCSQPSEDSNQPRCGCE